MPLSKVLEIMETLDNAKPPATEALNEAVPPGSLKYTSTQHQRRLQALYAVAHGRDAIVRRHGRTA